MIYINYNIGTEYFIYMDHCSFHNAHDAGNSGFIHASRNADECITDVVCTILRNHD